MSIIGSALAVGLYSVHNLIPSHLGATAAAGIIGVDIGKVILMGLLIAIPATLAGFLWVNYAGKKYQTKSANNKTETHTVINEIKNLPGPLHSAIPIFLPILLISIKSVYTFFPGSNSGNLFLIVSFIGDPIIALLLGLITSLSLFPKLEKEIINKTLNEGMANAGVILLITAAGGTFGSILKVSGIGNVIGNSLSPLGIGLLLPVFISAALKTVQGSSTVAIITAASLVMPLLPDLNLASGLGHLFVVLSLGAGSMVVSHANDSFFWVVTKFSDLDIDLSLRVLSVATLFMGITAEIVILMLAYPKHNKKLSNSFINSIICLFKFNRR
jgi:gluconate:H+ symporter, GntP family